MVPQMSPMSWTMIFLMLLFTLTVMSNLLNTISLEHKKLKIIEKKENLMKW